MFAARDPSGKEPLYCSFGSDGLLAFTNQPQTKWSEPREFWQEVCTLLRGLSCGIDLFCVLFCHLFWSTDYMTTFQPSKQMVDGRSNCCVSSCCCNVQVQPGHYVGGKNPKHTQQFALTPQQLSLREQYENMEDLSQQCFAVPVDESPSSLRSSTDIDSFFRLDSI